MTWNVIVAGACIGLLAIAVIGLIVILVIEFREDAERDRQAACSTISKHLGEYIAYKESIGEGADIEKLFKKFNEISKKEHEDETK